MSLKNYAKGKELLDELERNVKEEKEAENFIKEVLKIETIKNHFIWKTIETSLPNEAGEEVDTKKVTILCDTNFY